MKSIAILATLAVATITSVSFWDITLKIIECAYKNCLPLITLYLM